MGFRLLVVFALLLASFGLAVLGFRPNLDLAAAAVFFRGPGAFSGRLARSPEFPAFRGDLALYRLFWRDPALCRGPGGRGSGTIRFGPPRADLSHFVFGAWSGPPRQLGLQARISPAPPGTYRGFRRRLAVPAALSARRRLRGELFLPFGGNLRRLLADGTGRSHAAAAAHRGTWVPLCFSARRPV